MMNTKPLNYQQVMILTGLLLLIPFSAMLITNEVNWGPLDFVIMGGLCAGFGSAYVALANRFSHQKLLIAIALILTFLYVWAELAVGIFTNLGS